MCIENEDCRTPGADIALWRSVFKMAPEENSIRKLTLGHIKVRFYAIIFFRVWSSPTTYKPQGTC